MTGPQLTIPEGLEYSNEQTEDLLRRAFPFRAEMVNALTAGGIANPDPRNEHPVDYWLTDRYELHVIMRRAFERGMDWLVEDLEDKRESVAAQCAYTLALDAGDHPEVLEQARRKNAEGGRRLAEKVAQ